MMKKTKVIYWIFTGLYAGFVYGLTGAIYSGLPVGDPVLQVLPILIGFALIGGSYIYHHKRLKEKYLVGAG